MTLYLDEDDVRALVDMPLALQAVEEAHRLHGAGEAVDFPRQRTRMPGAMMHLLQGGVPSLGVMGYKVYTTSRAGARFWVHLFDAANGDPLAVMAADFLGVMRTGATGGVAAKYLARPDARIAGVFGAGWQAQSQIEALCAVRPIDEVRVFARTRDKLERFCNDMSARTGRRVVPAASPEATVTGADVVVTITTASTPVFDGQWLAPGTHVTAAGSNALVRREVDETTVRRAAVICVDSRATALREAGDLLPALEKGRLTEGRLVELGELINGQRAGRADDTAVTLFESQGMAIQDLALAAALLQRAREKSMGRPLPW